MKETLQINIAVNDPYDTIDCVRPTQSSVIWIIHRNVGRKFLKKFYQYVYLLLSLYVHISFIFYKVV